ncbi:hypothetical protein ABK040_012372 [Willaertia magna]
MPKRKESTIKFKEKKDSSSREDDDDDSSEETEEKVEDDNDKKKNIKKRTSSRKASTSTSPARSSSSGMTIRPRKLDVQKKLILLHSGDLKNVQGLKKKINSAISESKLQSSSTSTSNNSDIIKLSNLSVNQKDLDLLLDENYRNGTITLVDGALMSKSRRAREIEENHEFHDIVFDNIHIPIPTFKIIEDHAKTSKFKRPKKYIKYESKRNFNNLIFVNDSFTDEDELIEEIGIEYDLESEDEEWLDNYNKSRIIPLSELDFERIISILNRLIKNNTNYFISVNQVLDLSRFFNIELKVNDILSVKNYWEKKCNKIIEQKKNALEKIVTLENNFIYLSMLKNDFVKVKQMIELVKEREILKLKLIKNYFDRILEFSDVDILSDNIYDKAMKERKEENQKKNEINENKKEGDNKKDEGTKVPPVLVISDPMDCSKEVDLENDSNPLKRKEYNRDEEGETKNVHSIDSSSSKSNESNDHIDDEDNNQKKLMNPTIPNQIGNFDTETRAPVVSTYHRKRRRKKTSIGDDFIT